MTSTNASDDLSLHFAKAIAQTRYDNLPSPAIDAAKKSLLDTLGVILAASSMEPAVRPVLHLVRESAGAPESSVLGVGGRAPAPAAALANGAMAHCLDFDDRTPRGRHCGSSLVPAALALAERRGGVSGRSFIAAMAAGQDLFMRLRCNVTLDEAWNLSTVLGILSATGAASSVLGLDAERTANALGIASTQASGTMQVVHAASPLRGMYAGFTAQSAVVAALLAQRGMTGVEGALEGQAGLLTLCFHGRYERSAMLDGLGESYLGSEIGYKPWPVVGLAHAHIHATIELMKQHRLGAADIDRIHVYVGETQRQTCSPLGRRRDPQSAMEAKFSLPYCVALAAVHGTISVAHFAPNALRDPRVREMAQRVLPVEDSGEPHTAAAPAARVDMVTHDGRILAREGDKVPGTPQAPMTWSELSSKFVDCSGIASNPVPAAKARQVVEMVTRLEELDDVAQLVRALE